MFAGNGQRRAIELIGKKKVTAREVARQRADFVRKRHGFLINDEVFKGECRSVIGGPKKESRK
jgi:hypothetical protein